MSLRDHRLWCYGILLAAGAWCLSVQPALAQAQAGKRLALLVGINRYEHGKLDPLKYAVNDVNELGKLLEGAGYEVTLLTDEAGEKDGKLAPTKANIEKHLHDLARRCKKNDTFVLALTGHGVHFGEKRETYYCPIDARPLETATDTLVSINKIYTELDESFAGAKIVLVDACRNDPTPGRGRGLDADAAPPPPKGVAVLFSCSAGQKAFEHESLKHGVFFHYVLEGLRKEAADKKGRVTFDDLQKYVREEVADKVHALFPDQKPDQFPNVKGDFAGKPLVLLTLSSSSTPPDLAPAMLVAPFDERTAKSRQADWARHVGKTSPVEGNSLKMKLVLIPPGEFMMGASEDEIERVLKDFPKVPREWVEDGKRHHVRITQPFYLAAHEVTKRQFREFVTAKDYKTEAESDGKGSWGYDRDKKEFKQDPKYTWRNSGFTQGDDHPVVNVTWNDAVEFCKWLSEKEGKEYRLPSEAEWEYACRAGTTTAYAGGDDPETLATYGNVADGTYATKFTNNYGLIKARDGYVFTAPVGAFRANAFGLFDMHGNAAEWCRDWYRKDYEELGADNPVNFVAGSSRVIRGGGWRGTPVDCRSAHHGSSEPTLRYDSLGFRVARAR